jgi:hypothetical protein
MLGGREACVLAAAVVALGVPAGGAAAAGSQRANTTFADPTGDVRPGTPDITTVAVSDQPDGMVTIDATIVGDLTAYGSGIEIFIDTDKATDYGNPETSPFNAEYYFSWHPDGASGDWGLARWDMKLGWLPVSSDLTSYDTIGDHHVFRFHRSDIGDPAGFSFLVLVPSSDVAPSSGKWVYDLGQEVVTPELGLPAATPRTPVAGKPFVLTIPCTRAETDRPLEAATVTVSATVAGRRVVSVARYVESHASVRVAIPKSAAGKLFNIRITVTSTTKTTASKTLSYRVRRT